MHAPEPSSAPQSPRGADPRVILSVEDLAARWGTTVHTVNRRLRGGAAIKAINIGSVKHPELRFRLSSVEAWEAKVEQPAGAYEGYRLDSNKADSDAVA